MYQQGRWYIELKRLFVVVLGVEGLNFEKLNLKTWTNKTKKYMHGEKLREDSEKLF